MPLRQRSAGRCIDRRFLDFPIQCPDGEFSDPVGIGRIDDAISVRREKMIVVSHRGQTLTFSVRQQMAVSVDGAAGCSSSLIAATSLAATSSLGVWNLS
ncbi:hypothetical protein WT09_07435 [Burkholderia stagnalis]|nr:hypothetical protein WT74_22155 [Burkholderia stagnalis]KVN21097.1 hypothetical protein WT09_07435 [Burkholderia stagnalis]KWH30539.1 hypothetical protein WT61_01360 [Burkholderia stagnalis]KWH42464.1 hypothetical protein WT62_18025 [Burkholderia stagnalis]KWO27585.1 hypothetical protein WT95_22535 [Burkholderia stagnalis]